MVRMTRERKKIRRGREKGETSMLVELRRAIVERERGRERARVGGRGSCGMDEDLGGKHPWSLFPSSTSKVKSGAPALEDLAGR